MSPRIKYVSFGVKWLQSRINFNRLYTYWMRKKFRRLDSVLDRRVEIKNPQCISIGHNVYVRAYVWLCAVVNDLPRKNVFNPIIEIGDGTAIGRFCHITISNQLTIESNVLITEGVLITDIIHGFEDIQTPVIQQPMISLGPIVIGQDSWIGNRACIIGRVKIGKHVVIGANTYIDRDVPDYCVVAGSPARIIKRFNFTEKKWLRVNEPLPSRS